MMTERDEGTDSQLRAQVWNIKGPVPGAVRRPSISFPHVLKVDYRASMPPWLSKLIQQFGRDAITMAPDAANAIKNEAQVLRDPYIDKVAYFFRRGGEAERDAEEHRLWDSMNERQRKRFAELQIEGKLQSYENTKPKHLRPWTGAMEFRLVHGALFNLLGRDPLDLMSLSKETTERLRAKRYRAERP